MPSNVSLPFDSTCSKLCPSGPFAAPVVAADAVGVAEAAPTQQDSAPRCCLVEVCYSASGRPNLYEVAMVLYPGTAALTPAVQPPHLAAVGPKTAATAAGDFGDQLLAAEVEQRRDQPGDTAVVRARRKA